MRKIITFCICFTLIFVVNNINPIYAMNTQKGIESLNENDSLDKYDYFYAITYNNEMFDEYARSNYYRFALSFNNEYNGEFLSVGSNILVYGSEFEMVVYPIFYYQRLISTLFVWNENGNMCCSLSDFLCKDLYQCIEKSSLDNPIVISIEQNEIKALTISELFNDINETNDFKLNMDIVSNRCSLNCLKSNKVKNVSPSVYVRNWTIYSNNIGGYNYCYAYVLYNCFRNLSITSYTLNNIKTNVTNIGGFASFNDIKSFLTSEGFSYNQNSNKMSNSEVVNCLYYNQNCILAIFKRYNMSTGTYQQHAVSIIGFNNNYGTYTLWDPFASGSGRIVCQASNSSAILYDGNSYAWSGGAIWNFVK